MKVYLGILTIICSATTAVAEPTFSQVGAASRVDFSPGVESEGTFGIVGAVLSFEHNLNESGALLVELPALRVQGDLLLSLVFKESNSGFLRATWDGPNGSRTLASNLYEGRRTGIGFHRLLLDQRDLQFGGELMISSAGSETGIVRMEWEWLSPTVVLTTQDQVPPVGISASGQLLAEGELIGETYATPPGDQWVRGVLDAAMFLEPELSPNGVDLEFQLEAEVQSALLQFEVKGLPLDSHLEVSVNEGAFRPVALSYPDLHDPAYFFDERLQFAGKQAARAFVLGEELQVGFNSIAVRPATQTVFIAEGLVFSNVRLQVVYPPEPTKEPNFMLDPLAMEWDDNAASLEVGQALGADEEAPFDAVEDSLELPELP
ncbi:MAG: hypothetical protein ACFCU3_11815 [Verrucomicrobiales bacterium]